MLPESAVAAREGAEAEPGLDSAIVTTNSPARYLTELAGWRTLFPDSELRRDPFTQTGRPDGAAPAETGSDAGQGAEVPLTLQAVSIHADRALAVINRQVVAVGEKVSGFVVEKITPLEVTLTGDTGTRTIRIDHAEAPRAPSSESDSPPSDAKPAPVPVVGNPPTPH
jgi:hypothetical protein